MEQMENLPEEEKDMVMQLPNSYFERGKEEGIKKRNQEIALELIARKMPIDQIAEITELSKEDIKKLASE
ncbi:hypothetical protein GCM10011346_49780 [Oceanobacillus neutriphilus]|uniref:Transposase/invertase (TIGR01784 family) n=1 Tax=Oceanobacillus neutriphilus TaxID=531815 RepID=A0ABQ2P2R5_9BACI|nr:hypothetical protein GCM10011346_49780 [Oceanobacillus neutriphilus]